eukprot:tig00000144_g9073.t1
MARVGEGDPRWIVNERQDGANVNNWHWVEKDCSKLSRDRITELLEKQKVIDEKELTMEITKVDSISGEATANNRKGKRIVFYELDVKLKWKGQIKDSDDKVIATADGNAEITNLSEEQDADDLEVVVSTSGTSANHERLRSIMRTHGIPFIRKRLGQFIREFKAGEGCFTISGGSSSPAPIPPKSASPAPAKPAAAAEPVKPATAAAPAAAAPAAPAKKGAGRTIKMKVTFQCPAAELYECLVDEARVAAYTQSKATISREVGSSFSMFGGSITGRQVELVPGKRIVQDWRFSDWAEGVLSKVTMDLEQDKEDGNACVLQLVQEGVPETDAGGHGGVVERTQQGWRMHFFEKIKHVFNFGTTFHF